MRDPSWRHRARRVSPPEEASVTIAGVAVSAIAGRAPAEPPARLAPLQLRPPRNRLLHDLDRLLHDPIGVDTQPSARSACALRIAAATSGFASNSEPVCLARRGE